MTAPKRIWAAPSDSDEWHAPYAGRFECEGSTQYIRADLVAELVQAAKMVLQMHIAHHNATQHAALRAALRNIKDMTNE
jgi:hypothetical protein